ncbi:MULTISPECIES: aminotransferase class III-fold pyridoxal phosphate-dependent enzyme [unclassified Pseudonocardia]|jgi:4-aminobutyrate aminotransferase|uniref:aspartate aminotransferase family protein n=1 Tax=unclassified Pseudonocardia TaxID=2619320 RepID=UPI00095DF304|nr:MULTISPECIES: aminotransferase class III-fold pyridoxal phosphate-dependent enzyme [unclassified Pseudonocardia]MBN9099547.1 aminotransferase class III-fold pyridoxal phosphate-dependent enzyme [Pseudonocardia sp.]OJY43615.1 MAG: aspartate aminotransferase family protein [Pseudonocardia sp. 73-21]
MAQLSPLLKQATPVQVARGEGVYLHDTDGRRHLDFTAGIGVTSTGHCHPRVVAAAQEQVATLIHGQYTTVMHQPLRRLTERLGDVLPPALDSVFFLNSGSEAVEASVRLARHATGRPMIVAFDGGFHGRTMGAAALTTSGAKIRAGLGPMMGGVAFAPFPYAFRYGWSEEETVAFCLRELDRLLITAAPASDVAAFIVEPVLGEGGYVPTPPAFLEGLRERADVHGILLIADEVQTGFGRTGRFWGHQFSSVTPDILITAKGLASGFPLSGIAASAELMAKAKPGSQGGTYGGNAVACAAALATIDVIEDEGLVANAGEQGLRLLEGLRKVAADHPGIADVRGLGLMVGNEFCHADGTPDAEGAARAHAAATEKGLLLLTCGPFGNVVRMIPPLIVTADQVDEGVALWREALTG